MQDIQMYSVYAYVKTTRCPLFAPCPKVPDTESLCVSYGKEEVVVVVFFFTQTHVSQLTQKKSEACHERHVVWRRKLRVALPPLTPPTLLLLSFSSLQRQTRALTYTPRLARPNPLSLFSLCVRVSRVSPSSARFIFSLSHIHEHTHIDTASLLTRVPPSVPFILVLCLVDFLVSSRLVYPVLRVFHPRRLRAFSLSVLLLFLLAFLFSNDPHTHKSRHRNPFSLQRFREIQGKSEVCVPRERGCIIEENVERMQNVHHFCTLS